MDVLEKELKVCLVCKRKFPLSEFYQSRPNVIASRCKKCHGLAIRRCKFCGRGFVGKSGRKACSKLCAELLRAPTYLMCRQCGELFGPVDHLSRQFCSKECTYAAATTGRVTIRKTLTKARSAQSLLRYHILAGHITRPSVCEECGVSNRKIEGAHFSYDEPLRVRWLCIVCHRRWDKREPKGATMIVSGPGRRRKFANANEKTPTLAEA